ncbi:MAG: 16S rRNA (uracil(1498)-N(3))-methyltransferase [Limnohabitans sp.]|nr:16S rRNA (uracil(1498)-N(3))-methyltransferase [Limnohabitans sp.]
MPRFYYPITLSIGSDVALPPETTRHVQVHRLQPGNTITLFNGMGGSYQAQITEMQRQSVSVQVLSHNDTEIETTRRIHIAVGMPANDRMDWLIEKATELGVARVTPLMTEHSVLRLTGERAERKQLHWDGVAAAACAQCGRNKLPIIYTPVSLQQWSVAPDDYDARLVLSLEPDEQWTASHLSTLATDARVLVVVGPEGGLSAKEDGALRDQGFHPLRLGPRVMRVETAVIACLSQLCF